MYYQREIETLVTSRRERVDDLDEEETCFGVLFGLVLDVDYISLSLVES